MKIETNGSCMKCAHYYMCEYEKDKQDLISKFKKIDFEVKPFEIILKCPSYLKIEERKI